MGNNTGVTDTGFYESDDDDDDDKDNENKNREENNEDIKNVLIRIPKENHVTKIKELLKYNKKLGEGRAGPTFLVTQKFGDKKKCALKQLHPKSKSNAQTFLREIAILQCIKHENIEELYDVYLDKSSYFIATAYYSGDVFFDHIIKIKKFTEKQVIEYIVQILCALEFIHNKGIVHRDIKPSNMIFDKKGKNGRIKIIHFSDSQIVIDDDIYTTEQHIGTMLYAPPEWKKDRIGKHIKKGDLWSLGVIVYVLMVGKLPFDEWKHIESYNNNLNFTKTISYQCGDFIVKLLERDPNKRLSAKNALQHPWITDIDIDDTNNNDYEYDYNDSDENGCNPSFEELCDIIIKPSDKLLLVQYYARKYYEEENNNNFVHSDIIKLILILFPRISDTLNAIKIIPKQNHVTNIEEIFKYKEKIGEGSSSLVLLVEQKFGEKKKCALKQLDRKNKLNAHLFLREVIILKSLKHENIMEISDIYLDKSYYFIASSYYGGGQLIDLIIKTKTFTEKQSVKYVVQMLYALNFMHNKDIVHRDLKPSNVLFDRKGKNGKIKLIDFGTATIVIDNHLYESNDERIRTLLIYQSPEWKKKRYGKHIKKGDLWSLGLIVYLLMVGKLPFNEWRHIESYNNNLWFPNKIKQKLSHKCIDFIIKLLERDPNKRLSAKKALKHPWIAI